MIYYGDMHNICLSPNKNLNILVYGTQPVRVPKIYGNALIPAFPLVRHVYGNAVTTRSLTTTPLFMKFNKPVVFSVAFDLISSRE